MANEIVEYKADNGQDIKVTEQDVRDLMAANGNAMDNVTSQEVKMFLRLCQSQRLNPFTRDAYIVKYGNSPASVIAGKDAFVKRATRNKRYRGHEAGITIIGTDKKIHRREGSMLLGGETLVGGWCKVYLEGYECPIFDEVALSEYSAPDKHGKNGWAKMPATMIRKVAVCHALREAFPEDLGGLYGAEEMDQAKQQNEASGQEDQDGVILGVEDITKPPSAPDIDPPDIDPRKDLWNQAASLKHDALSLGISEQEIDNWMASYITDDQGNPLPRREYSADHIEQLIGYLGASISAVPDSEEDETIPEYEEICDGVCDLADHDIEF